MIKAIMKTSKGFIVSGCDMAYTPIYNSYSEVSGRVRVDPKDPSKDQMVRWDSNGNPIGHDFGELLPMPGRRNEEVNGFNLMSGLCE